MEVIRQLLRPLKSGAITLDDKSANQPWVLIWTENQADV